MRKEKNRSLTRRDRVALALSHRQPDRCPVQISFTSEFEKRLRADDRFRKMAGEKGIADSSPFFLERVLGQDLIVAWYGTRGWTDMKLSPGDEFIDEWGVRRRAVEYHTRFGPGIYSEFVGFPLADASAITRYQPPDPYDPDVYRNCRLAMEQLHSDYYIVGATVTTIFEKAWALRGYDRLLTDFVEDPGLAEAILSIPYQYNFTIAREMVKMGVDMIWTGDDMGTQHGMLISPVLWRQFFKPKMAHFFAGLKAINPALRIAYHSDGDISPIIPDLVEIGLDVLNPVQPACMDPSKLKKRYGKQLCFWGSIDEQWTLPFLSPSEVKKEVRTRMRTLGTSGGLILGPTHNVQLDTPLENFWAMYDAILEGY